MVNGLVPHQHQAGHTDHPVLGGEVPVRVDVDSATLDVTGRQLGGQRLKLRLELATRPAPVGVKLHQAVPSALDVGVEVVSCQLGRSHWHRLRIKAGNLFIRGNMVIRHTQGSKKQQDYLWVDRELPHLQFVKVSKLLNPCPHLY